MLSRTQLQFLNKGSFKYPLQIAEKDYVLALVMQLISNSHLGEKLVFKGGTALYHCYLDQYRYSEGLDFSSGGNKISLEEVQQVLTSLDYLQIKKAYTSRATTRLNACSSLVPWSIPIRSR